MHRTLRSLLPAALLALGGCDTELANNPDPDMNISVQVSGLDGTLRLFNSGVGSFGLTGSGNYTLATRVRAGHAFDISVARQPHGQTCVVSGGSGVAAPEMSSVIVQCAATTFPLAVQVSGFNGTLILAAGDEKLSMTAAGSATFPSPVTFGDDWQASIDEEPVGHACSISNNSGNATSTLTPVVVSCSLIDPMLIRKVTVTPVAAKTVHVKWQAVPGATHYRLLRDADGIAGGTLVTIHEHPSSTQVHDTGFNSHLLARAIYVIEACNALRCVATEPVSVASSSITGYLKVHAPRPGDSAFGDRLAMSADGGTFFVRGYRSDANWEVTAYTRTGGSWLRQKVFPGFRSAFGVALATSASGSQLAIADGDTIQLFTRTDDIWSPATLLLLPQEVTTSRWTAKSLALSGDGNTLAVGAYVPGHYVWSTELNSPAEYHGKVFMYVRESGAWVLKASLLAPVAGPADSFGTALSLSQDGNTLAVGAPIERGTRTGVGADWNVRSTSLSAHYGAAYVLVRNGDNWTHQTYLKPTAAVTGTRFGSSVSLSADGNFLAVGAPGDSNSRVGIYVPNDSPFQRQSGAVYVYGRTGTAWGQNAYIKASVTDVDDFLGASVSLSGDGRTLAVSATGDDSAGPGGLGGSLQDDSLPDSGAVFIFRKPAASWTQYRYLKAPRPDSTGIGNGDGFGSALALSSDATTLAVSAVYEDGAGADFSGDLADNSASNSGAVFLH